MAQMGLYRNYLKRLLDIVLSTLALIVLSPLLLITALLVRLRLGSPVVFKQPRPGRDERIFDLYKFRTMTNEKGPDGRLLPDAQRLTRFGKFLRASSLDELLELVNIIKGDMSIVGPRPLSIYYLPHYPTDLRRRHAVRPGLTGLAQVNGRNNLPWDDRFAMDIEYVDHVSFALDVKIVVNTALKVLKRADVAVRGASQVKDYGPYCVLKNEGAGGQRIGSMTYSEIGSYFWLDGENDSVKQGKLEWLPQMDDSCFTFSGRNAIDIALRDILKTNMIRVVYAPSYCCVSMLQAFIDRSTRIEFYDVTIEDGRFVRHLPNAGRGSIVLIMRYFGLDAHSLDDEVRRMREAGAVVIEDITHSLLSGNAVSRNCDYAVASLRKWFAIPTGGWVGKRGGEISEKPQLDSDHAVSEKISAMREKYGYLTGAVSTKEHFLLANAKFDNDLIHVDRMLKLDSLSLRIMQSTDVVDVIDRRRRNVRGLLEGLHDLDGTVLALPQVDLTEGTPLFLPVFLAPETRDSLRRYLTEQGIYCPIHWPEVMGAEAGIRRNELSLICDQRYGDGDMRRIVDAIHTWASKT